MDSGHYNYNKFSRITMKLINLLKKLQIILYQIFTDNYEIIKLFFKK